MKKLTQIRYELNASFFDNNDDYDYDAYALKLNDKISERFEGIEIHFAGLNPALNRSISFCLEYENEYIMTENEEALHAYYLEALDLIFKYCVF